MDASVYNELQENLNQLRKERKELQSSIEENELKIQEAQCFADKIMRKDEEDFTVFSPRKYEDLYRDELNASNDRKINYENMNQALAEKRDKLDSMIHVLESVASDWAEETKTGEENRKKLSDQEIENAKNKLLVLEMQDAQSKKMIDQLNEQVIQNLSRAIHKIEVATKLMTQDPGRTKMELNILSKDMQESIAKVRNLIFELQPMDFEQFTLKQAVEKMLYAFNRGNRYRIDFKIDNVSCENHVFLLSVYRVIQECFLNIRKHADANKILFVCENKEDILQIQIEDDGKGFILEEIDSKKYSGLSVMREQIFLLNGTLDIVSEPDKGTKISIQIPISV